MYLAQETCSLKRSEIENYMDIKFGCSFPTTVAKLKLRMITNKKLTRVVERIKREYDIWSYFLTYYPKQVSYLLISC